MKKLQQKLAFFMNLYLNSFNKRDKDLWIFGAWFGNKFADNPKYLFLYCISKGVDAYWITKNPEVYNELVEKKLPVEMADSKEGIELCKKAGQVVVCTSNGDVNDEYIGGANIINLWHGIPLKKVVYDDKITGLFRFTLKGKIYDALFKYPYKNTYYFSTSPVITKIYQSAFRANKTHVIEIGQVRNDSFFDGSLQKKKYSNIKYRTLISYLPTHRNEGKTKIEDHKIFDLESLENFCDKNECLFLIKKHFYHHKEYSDLSRYPHIIDLTTNLNIDTQELMYNSDILITDYSSCYIDYLLLDRPIVFYCFDYDHYLKEDREMYFNYEDVTPGAHPKNFEELLSSLNQALNGNEQYEKKQLQVKNLFYSTENQSIVAPQLLKTIKKL